MNRQRLEAQVLDIIEATRCGRQVEDARVELKAEWPSDTYRTARQIAGHANAARGEDILWVIGVDEGRQSVRDVRGAEPANWWPAIARWFDEESPGLVAIESIAVDDGVRVIALLFSTDRAPYVVSTETGGQVQREIPWRVGNSTRSAHRREILRSVVAQAQTPQIESIGCELRLYQFLPGRSDPYATDSQGVPIDEGDHELRGALSAYLSVSGEATLPQHKQSLAILIGTERVSVDEYSITGPWRFGLGRSPSGARMREPAGLINVLGKSSLQLDGSGEIDLKFKVRADDYGEMIREALSVQLELRLPVDRSDQEVVLNRTLHLASNSDQEGQPRSDYERWVQRSLHMG